MNINYGFFFVVEMLWIYFVIAATMNMVQHFLLFSSANEIQTLILVRYFQNLEFQIINSCDSDDACAVRIERERAPTIVVSFYPAL